MITKKRLEYIVKYLGHSIMIPSLVFHELTHIIMIYLLGGKIKRIKLYVPDHNEVRYGCDLYVDDNKTTPLSCILTAISPIIGLLFLLILLYFHFNIWVLLYMVYCKTQILPSHNDWILFNFGIGQIKKIIRNIIFGDPIYFLNYSL